jgi:hypothetical protein
VVSSVGGLTHSFGLQQRLYNILVIKLLLSLLSLLLVLLHVPVGGLIFSFEVLGLQQHC